jgi:uncharacterized membrane protein
MAQGAQMSHGLHRPVKEHHVHQRHFDRLVMLSDGVFAIAITLSALEIRPETQPGQSLWAAWSKPLAIYFLCFFLIGQQWVLHRRMIAQVRRLDGPATVISLIALIPMVIRGTLSGQLGGSATLIYSTAVAVTFACLALFWWYVAFVAKLAPDMDAKLAQVWLWQKIIAVVAFIGVACYSVQLIPVTIVCALAFLAVRAWTWRLQRSIKAGAAAHAAETDAAGGS